MNIDLAKSDEQIGVLQKLSGPAGRRGLCIVVVFGGWGALLSACGVAGDPLPRGVTVEQVVRGKDAPSDIAATSAADHYELAEIESLLGLMKADFRREILSDRNKGTDQAVEGDLAAWLTKQTKRDLFHSKVKRLAGPNSGTGLFVAANGEELIARNWILVYDGPYGSPVYSRLRGTWTSSAIFQPDQDRSLELQRLYFKVQPDYLLQAVTIPHNQTTEFDVRFAFTHQNMTGKFSLSSQGVPGRPEFLNRFAVTLTTQPKLLDVD